MRTISASESNAKNPYVLLYGGKHTHDLEQHPDLCMPINVGVNHGDCSTAAGRYQFITSTWLEKASIYHLSPSSAEGLTGYSFAPEHQDQVTYRWLKDNSAWSVSIPTLLRQGEITEVLRLLSGTWTSLGFGIETNSMSPYLVEIYQKVLVEELKRSPTVNSQASYDTGEETLSESVLHLEGRGHIEVVHPHTQRQPIRPQQFLN